MNNEYLPPMSFDQYSSHIVCNPAVPASLVFKFKVAKDIDGNFTYVVFVDRETFDPSNWPKDENGTPAVLIAVAPYINGAIGSRATVGGKTGILEFDKETEVYTLGDITFEYSDIKSVSNMANKGFHLVIRI